MAIDSMTFSGFATVLRSTIVLLKDIFQHVWLFLVLVSSLVELTMISKCSFVSQIMFKVTLVLKYCLKYSVSIIAFSALTCWLGVRKGIRTVKKRSGWCWRGYVSGIRCKWFAYGPAATPIISCFIKIQIDSTFLVAAYSGCAGKEDRLLVRLSYVFSIIHRVVLV